ncbi:MAG TPA: hypothetical protein VMZ52_01365 [Bryobacteraceae bacterium]|nr:hypothetical protein [Bryobacteraceae bacterium]
MHTRRLGAFIVGAWLLGILLMGYVKTQNLLIVDKIMETPPGPVAKDMEDLGPDITKQLLRYHASEANRFLMETWEVLQIGIGAAFLSASLFTAHRSKYLLIVSTIMMGIATFEAFYVTPAMTSLGRAYDFLPSTAASPERDNYQNFYVIHNALEIAKLLMGLTLAARLLFDRYGWKSKLLPTPKRQLRRRSRSGSGSTAVPEAGAVHDVNDPDNSHVNG